MNYEDFEIRIGPLEGESVRVEAHWSEAVHSDRLELALVTRLEGTLTAVADAVRGGGRDASRDLAPVEDVLDPRAVGAELFRTLFNGNIRDLYNQSIGRGSPLRIKLCMDLNDPRITPLASLPWELMYDHERREPLVLGKDKTIVRCPDIPRPVAIPPFRPPLRILFVMANPHGDLNLNEERVLIEKAIAAEGATVHTDFLEDATSVQLGDRLHQFDYHVVHFMGHGSFRDGEGVLLLQDGEYRGSDLATLMRNEPETRLLVLNACRTAEIARVHGQDPFEGVATALLMSGMPAVVAMQFPVSDRAAIGFAGRFYAEIAGGKTVEEAVASGRRKISTLTPGRHEWSTPVLFLRSDGNLFEPPAAPHWKSAEVPKLLVYLLDRVALRRELADAIAVQRDHGLAPLVGIVHGDDAQCHVELIERLQQKELPELIGLDARAKVTTLALTWPTDARTADEFRQQLTPALASQMRKLGSMSRTVDEISHALTLLDGPAMIYTHVVISELEATRGWNPIEEYVAYWNAFPQGSASRRLFVFLTIKYRAPVESSARSWVDRLGLGTAARNARKALESAARVRAGLQTLATSTRFDHIVLRVLPELSGVSEQDAVNWASDYDHLFLVREIKSIFREHEQQTGSRTIPMEEITQRLHQLLTDRDPSRRDVA